MVSYLEFSGISLSVSVTFLSILRNLLIFLYLNLLLFHLFQDVGSDCNSFHWITLANWNIALSSIEGFKRTHPEGFLITVFVGKLYQW
jgi:hypothetical protein